MLASSGPSRLARGVTLVSVLALIATVSCIEISDDGLAEVSSTPQLRDALYTPSATLIAIKNNITVTAYEWGWVIPNIQRKVGVRRWADVPMWLFLITLAG